MYWVKHLLNHENINGSLIQDEIYQWHLEETLQNIAGVFISSSGFLLLQGNLGNKPNLPFWWP